MLNTFIIQHSFPFPLTGSCCWYAPLFQYWQRGDHRVCRWPSHLGFSCYVKRSVHILSVQCVLSTRREVALFSTLRKRPNSCYQAMLRTLVKLLRTLMTHQLFYSRLLSVWGQIWMPLLNSLELLKCFKRIEEKGLTRWQIVSAPSQKRAVPETESIRTNCRKDISCFGSCSRSSFGAW